MTILIYLHDDSQVTIVEMLYDFLARKVTGLINVVQTLHTDPLSLIVFCAKYTHIWGRAR